MQKTIAFFDFDGTITTSDTMLELIKFTKGKHAYLFGMLVLSPFLVAMKLRLISTKSAKEKLLTYFFGGTSVEAFNKICDRFVLNKLPSLIRVDAIKKIKRHLSDNHEVVVVSASAENWIREWCNNNNLKYLATRLEIKDYKITGRLNGENCNGKEKVIRIKDEYHLHDYSTIYCYGDTKGDKPMLQLATFAYYKPFRS